MLNQPMATLLLCSVCLTLFPTHADYSNVSWTQYRNQTNSNRHPTPKVTRPWQIRLGLKSAVAYLKRNNLKKSITFSGMSITNQELVNTANSLLNWQGAYTPDAMQNHFALQQLYRGNLDKSKFTGYYTPIISAQLYADNIYRYPIYRAPIATKRRLSRAQIAAGALVGQGLEIAWTNDPIGLFYIHIQGSGILKMPNGTKKALTFDGSNGKHFRSIARYMKDEGFITSNPSRSAVRNWLIKHPEKMNKIFNINPRFIYFNLRNKKAITASGTPIITGHTIAVDTNYIPFGSVILAEVPVINTLGQTLGSEWRLLFPQDRGYAIKGPARMDIYTGIGETARETANSLTGYGRAYLLLANS
jgi:membrane-bound lytic murein transglycosylase A